MHSACSRPPHFRRGSGLPSPRRVIPLVLVLVELLVPVLLSLADGFARRGWGFRSRQWCWPIDQTALVAVQLTPQLHVGPSCGLGPLPHQG